MNDVDFPVAEVLDGHRRGASAPASAPIKVNMVVKRGTNDHEIVPMARHFRGTRHRAALHRVHGRRRDQRLAHGRGAAVGRGDRAAAARSSRCEPLDAERTRRDRRALALRATARGEIGVISSVTQAFCRDCNRARLSTEGKLFLCLFASRGHDLRALLRGGAQRRRDRRGDRPHLAAPRRPLLRAARRAVRPTRRSASGASRCTTSAAERSTAIAASEITGLVLAGGRGSRMGGVDKGLQTFAASRSRCMR